MKRYEQLFTESNNLIIFSELSLSDKIKRLSIYPYDKNKYYHVTNESNLTSILHKGIIGEDIWVSKGQPHKEYNTGICIELNLKNYSLEPDLRWKSEYQTFIVNEKIDRKDITNIFIYFDDLDMREDFLRTKIYKKSNDEIKNIIEDYNI